MYSDAEDPEEYTETIIMDNSARNRINIQH